MTVRLEDATVQKGLEGLLVAAVRNPRAGHSFAPSIAEVRVPVPATGVPLYELADAAEEDSVAADVVAGSLIAAVSSDSAPIHLDAERVSLRQGESAWVPASTPLRSPEGKVLEVEHPYWQRARATSKVTFRLSGTLSSAGLRAVSAWLWRYSSAPARLKQP